MENEIELKIPDIGDAKEIELVVWHAAEGDTVEEGEELCELVTDKAAFPLEAPFRGRLTAILKKKGEAVVVGETVARLLRI